MTVTVYRTGGNNPYRQLHKVRCDQCPDYTTTPALIDDAHDERSRHLGLHAAGRAGAVVRGLDDDDACPDCAPTSRCRACADDLAYTTGKDDRA